MIDDILAGLFGEAVFGRLGASRRAKLLARLFFGLLGAVLGVIGAVYMALRPLTANVPLRTSMAAVFVFLACFALFNVGLARTWRWPGAMFVASFVALFVFRIAFGP